MDNEQARVFANLVDDLVADRAPSVSDQADVEIVEGMAMARVVKGLLNPSRAGARFCPELRDRTVGQLLAMRRSPVSTLHTMLAVRTENPSAKQSAIEHSGIPREQLEGLLADTMPPSEIDPARLVRLGDAVGISARALLEAVRLSAARWYERLVQERMAQALPVSLAHLAGDEPVGGPSSVRDEVGRQLRSHMAALEELVRTREEHRRAG